MNWEKKLDEAGQKLKTTEMCRKGWTRPAKTQKNRNWEKKLDQAGQKIKNLKMGRKEWIWPKWKSGQFDRPGAKLTNIPQTRLRL